jgi:two-component system, cell cycle response regulator
MATVLIVDDDPATRRLLSRVLGRHSHRTVEAADGPAGLEQLRHGTEDAGFDTVLLDLGLPGCNGFDVLAAMKADPDLQDIPVVFVTGSRDDVLGAFDAGAHDYLIKPVDHGELIARVHSALRVKALQDELKLRNAELEQMNRTDCLTGLANRRHLDETLTVLRGAARRHDHDLSVLMVDLDHFKQLNDSEGHPAGDAVLREVGRRIRTTLRAEDVAGRWGGEEFQVLLPFTDETGAAVLAERLRDAIAAVQFEVGDGRRVAVTASIGVASRADGEADIVGRADRALYAAKAEGRNCVRMAGGATLDPAPLAVSGSVKLRI